VYIGAQKYKEPLKRHGEGKKEKKIYVNTFVFSDKHVALPQETLQRTDGGMQSFLWGQKGFGQHKNFSERTQSIDFFFSHY